MCDTTDIPWRQYNNGKRWRRLPTGQIEVEGEGVIRTSGDPISAFTAWTDFKHDWLAAYERFGIHPLTIIAMALIEATRLPGEWSHMDPACDRKEPGYVSDKTTPNRRSRGLMQTLLSTAQQMNNENRVFVGWDGKTERLSIDDLSIPHKSIMLGTAYLRDRADKYEGQYPDDDPVMLTGPYNAGSLRPGKGNPFGMRTYGEDRTYKFIRYYNDAWVVLTQLGIIDAQTGEVI
jgi:hypothetical protein